MTTKKITVERLITAPIVDVWRAYTSAADVKQWNAASEDWHTTSVSVDLRIGGIFSSRMEARDGGFGFDFSGTYTNIIEHKLIEYCFGDRNAQVVFVPTNVNVNVLVTFDPEESNPIEMQRAGWQAILDSFARFVETNQNIAK